MKTLISYPPLACVLIATQLIGPAMLWSADQRGLRVEATRPGVVAALSGEQLAVQRGGETHALQFREGVQAGDQITTGDRTVADVLIGNRAVVTLGPSTTAQFTTVSDEQTIVQIKQGLVRVAAAASALGEQRIVIVQTPTGQVQTRGGIVRVLVDQPTGAAEHSIGDARPYRASYAPNSHLVVAALTPHSESIQVEEGSAEIAGIGGKAMTVQAGQAVTLQGGQAGAISSFVNPGSMRSDVVATAGHSQTPKEGLDHLVALQVEQATLLGSALTGAAETGKGEAARKDHLKNVINGATGGVLLTNPSLVSALFGGGNAASPTGSIPLNRTGDGFGGANNAGCCAFSLGSAKIPVNDRSALLVFTRKDPIQAFWKGPPNENCLLSFCGEAILRDKTKVDTRNEPSVTNNFKVEKELVLVGGTPNIGHKGIAPTETLIVRGATITNVASTFRFLDETGDPGLRLDEGDVFGPQDLNGNFPFSEEFASKNSTFVVVSPSTTQELLEPPIAVKVGGTLAMFSNRSDGRVFDLCCLDSGDIQQGYVDGAITATSSSAIPIVKLTGGVTLDQGTKVTIGTTDATNNYFSNPIHNIPGAKLYSGSILSVIDGPTAGIRIAVTVQDRLLGVYDGSTLTTNGGNKALLSVLDAKLIGPGGSIPLIDIAAGSHFDRAGAVTPGSAPDVKVTSAVVTRSTVQLDGPLLEASAPLFALTKATMTTTSHFADLAGNKNQSLVVGKSLPGDAMVALNASKLTIQDGNLLNLHAATATVNGSLFSLTDGSTLTLNKGALFSLTDGSSLNLNANAFGVFGSGANTLSIDNNLCTATCFQLVNSANQPILLDGMPLHVAGATQDVVLPNNFNVFALAPGASASNAKIDIDANDALFHVDGTSTLTINGTTVVGQ